MISKLKERVPCGKEGGCPLSEHEIMTIGLYHDAPSIIERLRRLLFIQRALDPEVYIPFRLEKKEVLSHDTRMFRFALQTPFHVLGLPIGQHVSMKYVDEADGKMVMRSYTPTSSDINVSMSRVYVCCHG